MAENPYEPPLDNDPSVGDQEEASQPNDPDGETEPVGEPFPYFVPIVQFSARLLGVYLLVIGVAGLVEDTINILIYWQYNPGYYAEYHGRFAGSCVYTAMGIYLVLGGRWLIERVFLPVNRNS